jgi:hypothetical protein
MVLRHNNAAIGSMDALYLKGRRHKKPATLQGPASSTDAVIMDVKGS